MIDDPGRGTNLVRRLRKTVDRTGFLLLWGWILLSLFFVPFWLGFRWIGVALFLVGLVVCAGAAATSAYPVTTIGTKRRVNVERVADDAVSCDECGRPAAGGERRRFATERVCFGSVVAKPETGTNVYCPRCLEAERGDRRTRGRDEHVRVETERT